VGKLYLRETGYWADAKHLGSYQPTNTGGHSFGRFFISYFLHKEESVLACIQTLFPNNKGGFMSSLLLGIIIGWMVAITGYAPPAALPSVQFEPHSFFVEKVCGGKECAAKGWYNDAGIIYLDEQYQAGLSGDSYPEKPSREQATAASVLGHESVHYLQDLSGKYKEKTCKNFLAREEQAFFAQRIGMRPYLKYFVPWENSGPAYSCSDK